MKKKYTVHFNWYATADVEVLAESEEDAIEQAREVELDPNDYHYDLNEESVIGTEDVPDLEDTIAQAEIIIKKAEEDEIFFDLSPWPWIRTETWNGIDYNSKKELAENVFWDKHFDEIAFTLDGGAEVNLSELPELQQLELCLQIINPAESNGVNL